MSWSLSGCRAFPNLGVGKTKLIQGFCHGWGFLAVASPTYSWCMLRFGSRGFIILTLSSGGRGSLWDAGCVDYSRDAEGCVLVEWIDRCWEPFQLPLPTRPIRKPFVGCLSLHPPRQKGRYSLKILAIEWSQRQEPCLGGATWKRV